MSLEQVEMVALAVVQVLVSVVSVVSGRFARLLELVFDRLVLRIAIQDGFRGRIVGGKENSHRFVDE